MQTGSQSVWYNNVHFKQRQPEQCHNIRYIDEEGINQSDDSILENHMEPCQKDPDNKMVDLEKPKVRNARNKGVCTAM